MQGKPPTAKQKRILKTRLSVVDSLDGQESLKRAVASTRRGKTATPQQQADIIQKIEQLEAANPTHDPAFSKLLSGDWSLLYNGNSTPG